jgi:hypothetical protein
MQGFSSTFTPTDHWSPFYTILIKYTPSPAISLRFILILSCHLHSGLLNGLFSSGSTKPLYLFSHPPHVHYICQEKHCHLLGYNTVLHSIISQKTELITAFLSLHLVNNMRDYKGWESYTQKQIPFIQFKHYTQNNFILPQIRII